MPLITAIKQQRNKDRVNIYLDGKFGFGIDLDNFVKLNLKIEQVLSEKEIEEVTSIADYQKTVGKILNFATYRTRSTKEINNWLRRKKVPEEFHEKLFIKLNHYDLLDDMKFAKLWVEERSRIKKSSKRILIQELKLKGISQDIIETVLEETDIDEEKNAKEQLAKRMYRWKDLAEDKKKQKMAEFLARKGFSWEIAKKVINLTDEGD